MSIVTLPVPDFVDLDNAAVPGYSPDSGALFTAAQDWRAKHDIKPAAGDGVEIHILDIDSQFDFSFPSGSLYVAGRSGTGAVDAHRNFVRFVYENLYRITQITCTMDSHLPVQVFFPTAHVRADGSSPGPNTIISAEEYHRGDYRANPFVARELGVDPNWLTRQWTYYCDELEKVDPETGEAKYQLYLWDFHCLIGSDGHPLVGLVQEARMFHSFVRSASNIVQIKGGSFFTEHYSIFKPEVMTLWDPPGKPMPGVQKNTQLISTLLSADVVIIVGLADSHCVKRSIDDFDSEIKAQDPALAKKVYIMKDCSASVVIPGGPDFTPMAEAAYAKWSDGGMNVVESTTPMEEWPGMDAILGV